MAKYTVKTPIRKDGKLYEPGRRIELTEEEAAGMPWAVEPEPKAAEPEKAEKKKEK